jgi:CRISPR-associated protein Cmr4
MNTANALLFIHAQTSLHPGTGTALGTVDLPIQRERHTGWPNIAGSSIKGIIRDTCRERIAARLPEQDQVTLDDGKPRNWSRRKRADHDPELTAVFGPPTGQAEDHAGAISITDARILAFPVRSAKSVFAWVTCPSVLGRWSRDAKLAGEDVAVNDAALKPLNDGDGTGRAFTPAGSPLVIDDGGQKKLLLEEYDFVVDSAGDKIAATVASCFADHAVADEFTKARLRQHLVILPDTEFTHFVRHATEVAARIGLDYETKTVSGGALFYEEFLPAETLLYAVVLAGGSRRRFSKDQANERRRSVEMSDTEVLAFVRNQLPSPSILQIGGNETIGKGLCAVRLDTQTQSGGKESSK